MNCSSCGTPLPDNTRICPKCGALTPNDASPITSYFPEGDAPPYVEHVSFIDKANPDEGNARAQEEQPGNGARPAENEKTVLDTGARPPDAWRSQPPASSPTPPAGAWGHQQPYPPQNPVYPGIPSQQAYPPQNPAYPGMPPQQQHPAQIPPYYGPQYPAQPQSYPAMGPQPYPNWQGPAFPPTPQAAAPQSPWIRYLVIAVSILIVLMIALFGVGYFSLLRIANNSTAQPAATVNSQPTGAITTTDPQALFMQVTSRAPSLNDTLHAPGSISWQNGNMAGSQCTFTGGALHVTGPKGAVASCADTQANLSNFAIQVQMTITQGDSAGLSFATNIVNNKYNGYTFVIAPSGVYNFYSVSINPQDNSTSNPQILGEGRSPAINTAPNQPNLLTIIARNQSMYVYINKQYISTATDTITNANTIWLVGSGKATQVSVDVAYNNFQVWNI